jgi:pimeloyl-ACP methyl ester carboxylesterase
MDVREFHASRCFAEVPSGRIAYIERGAGPAALFLHGVPLNGFHWRHIISSLAGERRCIALDLMGLGYTEVSPTQDISFNAQAQMVAEVLDALSLDRVDLIANDSGGAIAQIFAVNHQHRLRTLTLTNCDAHDNWPPQAILPNIEMARKGTVSDLYRRLLDDPAAFRARFTRAYADSSVVTDAIVRLYLQPLVASAERCAQINRYFVVNDNVQTVSIEPLLRKLQVPTLIVWALEDIFFGVEWAHWLKATIPGAVDLVEVPGAKLFFPEDRPDTLLTPLQSFLAKYSKTDVRCPKCGAPMKLVAVHPKSSSHPELQSFRCDDCQWMETSVAE